MSNNHPIETVNDNSLSQVAQDLSKLPLDPKARLNYDLMSDALIWSDERPTNLSVRELWCLRPVFRYRTGLILGLELAEFRPEWDAAKRLFPGWIGFRAERSSRDAELEKKYLELSKRKPA